MLFLRHNKIRIYLAVINAILLIALGLLLVSKTSGKASPASTTPPSANQPPIYPNATNVKIVYSNTSTKYASFQSSDNATDVQDYYKNVLQKEGWKLETVSRPATPNSLYFSWSGQPFDWDMRIIISTSTDGLLDVKIWLFEHNYIL